MARKRIIGTARNTDEIADRLHERKNALGLSDALCDELGGLASGHTGKLIGTARSRGLGRLTLDILSGVLGVSFLVVVDMEKVRRMGKRWEKRNGDRIHIRAHRLSKAAAAQAKLEIYRELGSRGGKASARHRSAEQRSKLASKAAHAMHAKRRAMAEAA
jgi:hypothetical protein